MTNFKNISKRLAARICAVCTLSVVLSSCLKNHDTVTPVPPVSLLSVIQASPGEPVLDFYLNNTRVNNYGLNYGDYLDYFRAYSGKRTLTFYKQGTVLLSDTATLAENVAYSAYLINKPSNPQILLLTDSLTKPSTGNATVRFVNVSPDAPAVDLAVSGGSVLVANKSFKGFSSFIPIAGKSYSFEIRQAGTTTVLATLNNVTLNNGYIYTIWFHGLATPTGTTDKLTADLITNAFYY